MPDPFSFVTFLKDFAESTEHPSPEDFDVLLEALGKAEHPRSIRTFIWALLRTFERQPILQKKLMEEWAPKESDLAQLLEDVGKDGAQVFLSLKGGQDELERLWQLCDECEIAHRTRFVDPWVAVSLSPMAALEAERHLDTLITTTTRGGRWKDPTKVLAPEGEGDSIEVEPIVSLSQKKMVAMGGGSEALNLTVMWLLRYVEQQPPKDPVSDVN